MINLRRSGKSSATDESHTGAGAGETIAVYATTGGRMRLEFVAEEREEEMAGRQ